MKINNIRSFIFFIVHLYCSTLFSQTPINTDELERLLKSDNTEISFLYVYSDNCDPSNAILPYINKYAKKYEDKIDAYMINMSDEPMNFVLKFESGIDGLNKSNFTKIKKGQKLEVKYTPSFIIFHNWKAYYLTQGLSAKELIWLDDQLNNAWKNYVRVNKTYYSSGELYSQGLFNNEGIAVGTHNSYYKNGNLSASLSFNGLLVLYRFI